LTIRGFEVTIRYWNFEEEIHRKPVVSLLEQYLLKHLLKEVLL